MDDFEKVVRDHGIGGRGKRVENWGNGAHNITKSEINSGNNQYLTITTKPQVKGYIDQSTVFTHDIFGAVPGNVRAGQKFGGNSGGITELTGTFTADATAAAADIKNGLKAGINGNMVTGTMPVHSGWQSAPWWGNADQNTIIDILVPNGYFNGVDAYLGIADPSLAPPNIVTGATIFNVSGTAQRWAQLNGTWFNDSPTLPLNVSFNPRRVAVIVNFTYTGSGTTRIYYANLDQAVNYMVEYRNSGSVGSTGGGLVNFQPNAAIIDIGPSKSSITYNAFLVE